ncbi:MAG: hypothetical protein II942_04830 [Alphaproteobacteria bacterium]|nr:hypothetical protein [Alphaproteobacteria bacterium]
MKKFILGAILLAMGVIGPVCAETDVAANGVDSEEISEDVKNFLNEYLTARFSVYDDMEKQEENWGEMGFVAKYSESSVWFDFYNMEVQPSYKVMKKKPFTRTVVVNDIQKTNSPGIYKAEGTMIMNSEGEEERRLDFRVLLQVCEDKVCRFALKLKE